MGVLVALVLLMVAEAGARSAEAAGTGTHVAAATGPAAATTQASGGRGAAAGAASVAQIDRAYAREKDRAAREYERAVRAASDERVRQLRAALDRAMAAKDLDEAVRDRDALAAAEAAAKSIAPPGDRASAAAAAAPAKKVVLHIMGKIDGRNVLVVRRDAAEWKQQEFGYPESLSINGVRWDPSKNELLHNSGATEFLPAGPVNFRSAALVQKRGRDLVEVEALDDAVQISFNDIQPGAANYDLLIELTPAAAAGDGKSRAAQGTD